VSEPSTPDPRTPRSTRGPYAGSAARRADILRAARDCFAERGYSEASLRDIAARAGMTHAGLLHHFPSKDDLLVAVLAQRDAEEHERAAAAGAERPPQAGGFGLLMLDFLREHQRSPELMRLWVEMASMASRPNHAGNRYFVDRYARGRALIAQGLRDHAAALGRTDTRHAEHDAAVFMAALDGLQTQWLLDPTHHIVAAFERFLQLLTEHYG
jgi:AcrR family transcriptional regulator